MKTQIYDVAIIGGGIAGTTMGAILARHGYRVVILERGKHPRFAIGESMLPQSSMWMWITAEQFQLPELHHLNSSERITEHIAPTCGIKRSIAFAYHRPSETANPAEVQQFIAPELPITSESHLFREDIDLYLWQVAQKYGADCREQVCVKDVAITEEGVRLHLAEDGTIEATFVVDASGYGSPLAQKFGYRDETSRTRTQSRAIFTHVTGLPPFDNLLEEHAPGLNYRLHDGTLHHVFDGGWMWIIPFNNHAGSTNSTASIGLMLDTAVYPKNGKPAGQEFWDIVRQFPSIAAHMEHIEPVREWIATDRVQYTASAAVGARFMLLSNAHSFVDPLYSRGLISTFETIHAAALLLLEALADDNFSPERFNYLNILQEHALQSTDRMVHNAYRAMRHFEVWNAWTQLWVATKLFGDIWLFRHCLNTINNGDLGILRGLTEYGPSSFSGAPYADELEALVTEAEHHLDRLEAGEATPTEAAEGIYRAMRGAKSLPKHIYDWGNSSVTHGDFNANVGDLIIWGKTAAPEHIRTGVFDFELPTGGTAA